MRFDGKLAAIVWNPGAGSAERAAELRALLEEHPETIVVETHSAEDADEAVRAACEAGVQRIVAAGGDGTVNQVVNAIYRHRGDHSAAFAVLPLGTGNDLARTLGMVDDPNPVQTCLTGPIRAADIVRATWDGGDRIVANMATGGNTGQFMERSDDETKKAWGPLFYIRGIVDLVRDLRSWNVVVRFDGDEPAPFDLFNFFVANGRTSGGGYTVAPHASLFSGKLDAMLVRAGEPGQIVGLTADYLLASFLENDLIEQRQVARFSIQCDEPLPVSVDGDLVTDGPIEFRILAGALPVVLRPEPENLDENSTSDAVG